MCGGTAPLPIRTTGSRAAALAGGGIDGRAADGLDMGARGRVLANASGVRHPAALRMIRIDHLHVVSVMQRDVAGAMPSQSRQVRRTIWAVIFGLAALVAGISIIGLTVIMR